MKPMTFFLFFIALLSIILLAVNFILAPHMPYKEKLTPFECGYHSFLDQNRAQFNVSFFTFGILFLILDLEIVLIYPLAISSVVNNIYGLVMAIIFIIIVTIGFVFELGKNALSIESKQSKFLKHSALFAKITLTSSIRNIIGWNIISSVRDSLRNYVCVKLNIF